MCYNCGSIVVPQQTVSYVNSLIGSNRPSSGAPLNVPDLWETSYTNRRLPGTPAAKLSRSLGHNEARRSGQQYAPKLSNTGAYGGWN